MSWMLGKQRSRLLGRTLGRWIGEGPVLNTELLLNGNFATDTIWSKPADWTISGGVATKVNSGNAGFGLSQPMYFVPGASYEVIFTVTARTAGLASPRFYGGTTVIGASRNAVGTYTETLVAAVGNNSFSIYGTVVAILSVDNVSLKRIS